jgi:hypothetical protein
MGLLVIRKGNLHRLWYGFGEEVDQDILRGGVRMVCWSRFGWGFGLWYDFIWRVGVGSDGVFGSWILLVRLHGLALEAGDCSGCSC